MFKRSLWLEKYGLVPKIFLAILLFVCIGGLDAFLFLKDAGNNSAAKYSHNAKLDNWDRPPPAYKQAELEDWTARRKAAEVEIKKLLQQAEAKGDDYSVYDYFQDFDQLMVIEDEYHLHLTSAGVLSPLEQFVRLRDRKGILNGKKEPTEEELSYITSIQKKISLRRGEYYRPSEKIQIPYCSIFIWLVRTYLMFMGFWFFIYLIRFQERKTAKVKVQRHIHNTDRFYDAYEDLPGNLSLRDELLLCPWRFINRVAFWPFFCLKYPFYETTAEMLRFNSLKAEFLRYKPIGYQLSAREEVILRARAKAPVKNFAKAIQSISELEIYPNAIRRSLAAAYLSLVLGIVLQPAIVFAAQCSKKVDHHFCGQTQIVQMQQVSQHQLDGPDPPQPDQHQQTWQAVLPKPMDLQPVFDQIFRFMEKLRLKLPLLIFDIDHVPIARLFGGAFFCEEKPLNQTSGEHQFPRERGKINEKDHVRNRGHCGPFRCLGSVGC